MKLSNDMRTMAHLMIDASDVFLLIHQAPDGRVGANGNLSLDKLAVTLAAMAQARNMSKDMLKRHFSDTIDEVYKAGGQPPVRKLNPES